MPDNPSVNDAVLDKLFEIYRSTPYGSEEEAAALRSIGKVGTPRAIAFLSSVFDAISDEEGVGANRTKLIVIEALGNARSRSS